MALSIIGRGNEAKVLVDKGIACFQKECIELSSGIMSPGCYVDCRKLPSHYNSWQRMLLPVIELVFGRNEIELIAGVDSGGVPHGSVIAYECKLPYITARKETKNHGLRDRIAGDPNVYAGKTALVVEDVGVTGESAIKAVRMLRDAGVVVTDVAFLVCYDFAELHENAEKAQVNVHAVCTFAEVIQHARRVEAISAETVSCICRWLQNPRKAWWHSHPKN